MTPYRQIGSVHSTWLGQTLMVASNGLTLLRAVLSPLVFVLLLNNWWRAALATYAVGLLTDFLDGILARTFASGSPFGRAMDSTADKMLVFSGLLALERLGYLPAWVVLAFVLREFLTFGLRAIRPVDGKVVAEISDVLGRIRFFVLHVGIVMLLLSPSLGVDSFATLGLWVVTAAIGIAWIALVYYVRRDWVTILASTGRPHEPGRNFRGTPSSRKTPLDFGS